MACAACGTASGPYQIVTGEGTVPAQVNGVSNSFATAHEAQTALNAAGVGGYVRQRASASVR